MAKRSSESRKLVRQLTIELAAASARAGVQLGWTPQEETLLTLICDETDRKVEILAEYERADDPKAKMAYSAEARLLENSIGRLLLKIRTDPPAQESRRSQQARAAAMTRWRSAGA
jgi:hypothetical protein